ncbi:MAG: cobalamin-dependent protein, partial [Chlorobium sp.]|nr:cobalamin-dependent protein [Chlorobium sp.]
MKILLIYPEFPDTFWSFKHALKFVGKKAALPPLGMLTVASMLPGNWERRLVDLNVRPLKTNDLSWADMAFVSAMAVQQRSAREIIDRCKRAGVKVVAGGPLFTSEHEQFPGVDHFVLNEAELTLPQFLEDLDGGVLQRLYVADVFADISRTPAPQWNILEMRKYASMAIQ